MGAIDLASIMVGVIVIGLIGGVVAATVFTVIPWSQDNAAKQQLDSISSAESAYMGLSSAVPSPLPAGYVPNSFGNSAQLAAGNLLSTGATYCAVTPADGKSYTGYSKSASGKVWSMTDKNTRPALLTDPVPAECGFTTDGTATPVPYVDPTPTMTSLTYKCDTTTSGTLPWQTNLTGTETWDDGTLAKTYTNATLNSSKTLTAGVTYKVTFDGTYKAFSTAGTSSTLAGCLISMDHWGANTGVTDASYSFKNSNKLITVPEHIPSSITSMGYMFQNAISFNDPNISNWNVSKVTNMAAMFVGTGAFNQPLNDWNMSGVISTRSMFEAASAFNQPLDKWDTSKVTDMSYMFNSATKFNQYIKSWNVSKVISPINFRNASALTAANSPF